MTQVYCSRHIRNSCVHQDSPHPPLLGPVRFDGKGTEVGALDRIAGGVGTGQE